MAYMEDLGRLALGSRMKRLVGHLMAQTNALYTEMGIDMDASGFTLLNVAHEKGPLNLREAQAHLGTSHADISQKANTLKKRGLIAVTEDPNDRRARTIAITDKGRDIIKQTTPLWQAIDRTIAKTLHPHEDAFFQGLMALEGKLDDGSLIREYKADMHGSAPDHIDIVDYRPEHRQAFRDINVEWLRKFFTVEPVDEELLDDPEGKILRPGGAVFMAQCGDEIVGTCALYKNGRQFELCKMGVDPRYRGRGIAGKLITRALDWARAHDGERVYLLTCTKLKSAHAAYKKRGFVEVPVKAEDTEKYARVDVRMEKQLRDQAVAA